MTDHHHADCRKMRCGLCEHPCAYCGCTCPRRDRTLSWYVRLFAPAPRRWWHRLLRVAPGAWRWSRFALTVAATDEEAAALLTVVTRWLDAPRSRIDVGTLPVGAPRPGAIEFCAATLEDR